MSFDVAAWSQSDSSVQQSADIYQGLCNGDASLLSPQPQASADVSAFLQELVALYPLLNSYTDDDVDDCLWISEPQRGVAYVLFSLRFSRAEEAFPVIADLAYKHRLACYDPQKNLIRVPAPRGR